MGEDGLEGEVLKGVLHAVLGEAREEWERGPLYANVGALGENQDPGATCAWPRTILHQLLCSVDPTRSRADDSTEWAKTVWRSLTARTEP